jgi:hypothetical protein
VSSPFLVRHLALLLLATANLALSLFVLVRAPGPDSPLWLGVVARGAGVVYAIVSILAFAIAAIFFFFLELDPDARACWARRAVWDTILPGMKREEVLERLGKPFSAGDTLCPGAKEQLSYGLHALGALDEGAVFLDGNGAVVSTSPDAASFSEWKKEWGPRLGRVADTFRESTWFVSVVLILILTLATFTPMGSSSFRSVFLYTPLVALLLGTVYELTRGGGGWRYDLLFTVPAYLVIGAGWLLRLVLLARRS